MQGIQERFEFLVGDFVTGRSGGRLRLGRLGVGDGGHFGKGLLDGFQGLLDAFEHFFFRVQDQVIRSAGLRCRRFGLRFGKGIELRQKLRGGLTQRLPGGNGVEHAFDRVVGKQDDVHHGRGQKPLSLAQHVEHVFRAVADLDQRLEIQKTGAALDGVKAPEDGVEQIAVLRPAFQEHELLVQLNQYFAGFDQKILEYVLHPFHFVHGLSPQKPRLESRSSTSS